MAMVLFSSSPELHARLHCLTGEPGEHHDHHHSLPADDSGCAVVVFAQNTSLPLPAPDVLPPQAMRCDESRWLAREVFLIGEPYRFQPERGPPLG